MSPFRSSVAQRVFFVPVLILALLALLTDEGSAKDVKLLITAGGIGGSYFAGAAIFAEAFEANIPGVKTTVVPGGNFANPTRLDREEADIGYSSMVMATDAMQGREPYKHSHKNVRGMANFGGNKPEFFQFAILKETGITSFREMVDKKFDLGLCTGTRGTGSELMTRRVLEEYGMSYDTIKKWGGKVQHSSWTEATSLISDRHAHAVAVQGPPGVAWLTELCVARDMVFLPLDQDMRQKMVDKYGVALGVMPANMYRGQESDILTVSDFGVILCRADLPEDIVYKLTKALVEVRGRLKDTIPMTFGGFEPETACKNTGFPLHPGAEKYFREMGYLK